MQPELIGGRYRVESAIGRGGMGTVWLCQDETLHRHVAVKQVGLLPGESVTDSARAFREARSSAGLSHRNVWTAGMSCTWLCIGTACAGFFAGGLLALLMARLPADKHTAL